jgi:hypothetical protein
MKKQIVSAVAALALVSASTGVAQVLWNDNFESYADTAALSPTYTQIYPAAPMLLDTTKGYNSDQSIHFGITTANSLARAYFNLPGGPVGASDEAPITVSFMVDLDTDIWSTRQYIELRSYSEGEYNAGTLNQLFALGFTSSGVDAALANKRDLYAPSGSGWGNLSITRASIADPENEWNTKLSMVVKSSTIEWYVNDIFDGSQPINPGLLYDSIVIGSGLSSAGADVWFDNLQVYIGVIPEPSSLALSLLGGFGLLAAFRRRR